MARVVGIDLGSLNSVMCVLEDGQPRILVNAEGSAFTSTVVSFIDGGRVLAGQEAFERAHSHPGRSAINWRRQLGTEWQFTDEGRTFGAPKIAACVLMKLKRDAEAQLGEEITDVVISVPSYFGVAELRATTQACTLAGLRPLRLVGDAGAAAFAYAMHTNPPAETILVADLGGGTFSVAVVRIDRGVAEVRAVRGDNALGGHEWGMSIVQHLLRKFHAHNGIHLGLNIPAFLRVTTAARNAKHELSSVPSTIIELPSLATDADGNQLSLTETLTRAEFASMTADLLDRCRSLITAAITDAGLTTRDIDRVIPVGAASRMAAFDALITEFAGGREPYRGLPPEQAVAFGLAAVTGVLDGTVRDHTLLDCVPTFLGIAVWGGGFAPLIARGSRLPSRKSIFVTTTTDNQSRVSIEVFQGIYNAVSHNRLLGVLHLDGLPPAPRGGHRIEIAGEIDPDNRITVTARNPMTGAEQTLIVDSNTDPLPSHDPIQALQEVELHPDRGTGTGGEHKPGPRPADVPARQRPSESALTVAANHLLGHHLSTHPHRWYGGSPLWIYGIPIAIVAALLVVGTVTKGAAGALGVTALVGIGLTLTQIRNVLRSPRHLPARVKYARARKPGTGFKDAQLSLFEQGAVISSSGTAAVFRWDTVTVRQDLAQSNAILLGALPLVTMRDRYLLSDPSGIDYQVNDEFLEVWRWGPTIWGRVREAQLPGALAAVEAGQTLTFGWITLNRNEVTARGKTVPWSDVQEIRNHNGFISIHVAGQRHSLIRAATNGIPNVFVFLEIAEQLRVSAKA
ncbi:DUF6585 family protein [Nocardia sp. NBC_01327]|uniref:DUF6585 family protein n=1 Tax=Nocardia sp. NBC_01327 TaxID=2903593 RepID=UPI002E11D8AC|nr:heat shock 70 family protein [Nocardia sp. NBC_01327]